MPMMHPEDEANTDAPLVPQIRTPNRPTTTTTRDGTSTTTASSRDPEAIRREIRELRSRLDAIEADTDDRGDR